jgi:hypothetical protein
MAPISERRQDMADSLFVDIVSSSLSVIHHGKRMDGGLGNGEGGGQASAERES